MGSEPAKAAAIGWRAHSGWAVVVAVGGSAVDPIVLGRERVELLDGTLPRQPYHAAAEGAFSSEDAARLIARVERAAVVAARRATESMLVELRDSGQMVVGAGLVAPVRRLPAELAGILASHPLLHAAEGKLYEDAITESAARAGLPLLVVDPKSLVEDAATALGVSAADLNAGLAAAGKRVGAPWQKDHREAATAALAALRLCPGDRRR
jgi:hypothetical protein